jgi:hypothetical protein
MAKITLRRLIEDVKYMSEKYPMFLDQVAYVYSSELDKDIAITGVGLDVTPDSPNMTVPVLLG